MLPQVGISGGVPAPRKDSARLGEDRGGADVGGLHDQRRDGARQDVAQQDFAVGVPLERAAST